MGRAPAWPEAMPGKQIWAYSTGIIFVVAGYLGKDEHAVPNYSDG